MLKMMCPNCHELIISSLLAEIDEVSCHHCNEGVPVHDVLISARGMTINRDDLLKRFFRYKKLLAEVVDERALMEESVEVLEASKKSTDQFIETLEELMHGARDNFRLHFSNLVQVRSVFASKVQTGQLVNLSMVGVRLKIENCYFVPEIGTLASIEFSLPGQPNKFALDGMVAWIKDSAGGKGPSHDVGVKFVDISDESRAALWQLISGAVQDVMTEETID